MVQRGSFLNVADNSGAKRLQVINIPGHSFKKNAFVGDLLTCAVVGATSTGMVKDHEVVSAVLVRASKERRRRDGSYVRFDDNSAVLVDKEKRPRGTRIFGPVARELREAGYVRIVNLATEVW